jgi:hypothetical protein
LNKVMSVGGAAEAKKKKMKMRSGWEQERGSRAVVLESSTSEPAMVVSLPNAAQRVLATSFRPPPLLL